MKYLSVKKYRLFVAAVSALLIGGTASAQVDPAVDAAITAAQTNVVSVIGALTVAAVAIMAAFWVYRVFNRR